MGVGAGLYMCDVVKKSSRSLSHLLMSSCTCKQAIPAFTPQPQSITILWLVLSLWWQIWHSPVKSHVFRVRPWIHGPTHALTHVAKNFVYLGHLYFFELLLRMLPKLMYIKLIFSVA